MGHVGIVYLLKKYSKVQEATAPRVRAQLQGKEGDDKEKEQEEEKRWMEII